MILSALSLIRWIIGIVDFLIMTIILYPISFLPTQFTRIYLQPLYRYWFYTFTRAVRVNLKLHQKNSKDLPKQYILIGNHPSVFEDIGMPWLFPVRYLAKHQVKDWWIVGKIGHACGTLYVNREDKVDRKRSVGELKTVLKAGDSIGLYPEGGCKGRRIFLPFRHGVFKLSIATNVPIVPVFLHYESQEDFEWFNQHILHKIWMIMTSKNRTANYYVYDAIDPKDFSSEAEFCEHVQNRYLEWQKRYFD